MQTQGFDYYCHAVISIKLLQESFASYSEWPYEGVIIMGFLSTRTFSERAGRGGKLN